MEDTDTVKVEDLSSVEKKICINVAPTTVDQKFNDFFSNLKKDAQVPGWRKGKAPITVIQRHFKERAKGVVSQILISEFYQNALKDHNINAIGNPIVSDSKKSDVYLGKFNTDNSYSVELIVEVMPTIDPVGYNDIDLNQPEHDIKGFCNAKMKEYQEQFAERIQITDGAAEIDDTLVVDFKGFLNNIPFDGGESNNFLIDKLGSGTLIPGFEEKLVGMHQGQLKRIKVTFPSDYAANHLAGKDSEFDITVHSIVRKNLANADDDLAMMIGYESIGDLEEYIGKEVGKEIDKSNKAVSEAAIINNLIAKNDFEIPKSLITEEMNKVLKSNNITSPSEEVLDKVKDSSINNIKKSILFDTIYNKEKIDITPDELSTYLDEQAKVYNKDKDEIVSMLYNTNQMDAFVGVLRYRKVLDYIIDLNTKKDEDNERS